MIIRPFHRRFATLLATATLLLLPFRAKADTMGRLNYNEPQGALPPSPLPSAGGDGSFTFPSDLVATLTEGNSSTINLSDLTGLSLGLNTAPISYSGPPTGPPTGPPVVTGPRATYIFTLADVTSFQAIVRRQQGELVFQGFGPILTTRAVSGSIPDYGTATLSSQSPSVAGTSFLTLSFFPPTNSSYSAAPGVLSYSDLRATSIPTATPEPASFRLAAPALVGLWFMRRKKTA